MQAAVKLAVVRRNIKPTFSKVGGVTLTCKAAVLLAMSAVSTDDPA